MKVREIMTREVETIAPDTSLQAAAEKMQALDVGPLLVCEDDRLVGIITDRDVTVRGTSEGADPFTTTVREAMSEDLVTCREDQDVREAARMMRDRQIRRLPVLDSNDRLVGIVALGDIAVDTGDTRESAEALEGISRPS